MTKRPLCTRHNRAGTDDPELRILFADAEARAGRDLGGFLLVLNSHEGQLLATWRDEAVRAAYAPALSAAWRDASGDAAILNLVTTDDVYDYQEDVMENPVEDIT
jgi:hypothetical protein